ncbi:hypothetical protein HMPREF3220_04623 [Citrobacter koseri]|nr:hypothetical protein HMPREF3220_04623 [Citrobacter koseri]KWZ98642.1 hypothetical protein HMPREF3207_03977 [Citrobacter koseri]
MQNITIYWSAGVTSLSLVPRGNNCGVCHMPREEIFLNTDAI